MSKELEKATEIVLPHNTYAVLRVDGKNFSKFTKPMRKETPFNDEFTNRMERVAEKLCQEVSGAVAVYVQSDEVSVVFQDVSNSNSEKWMGGRVQKCASLGAAYASVAFNAGTQDMAIFDGRVFDLGENVSDVYSYLSERLHSGVTNSVSMLASSKFSHTQLMGVSTSEKKEMLAFVGCKWETTVSERHKFGTLYFRKKMLKKTEFSIRGGEKQVVEVLRNVWVSEAMSQNPDFNKFFEVESSLPN